MCVALAVGAACHGANKPPERQRPPPPKSVEIEWSMTPEPGSLRVDYAVTNGTDRRVYLTDQLRSGGRLDADAIIVADAHLPKTVALRRFFVRPVNTVLPHRQVLPEPRALEPGAIARGRARVPLPLRAWHNYAEPERIPPLSSGADGAVLEIGVVDSIDPPALAEPRILRGRRLDLPDDLPRAPDAAPDLEWSMAVEGDRLRIDYAITNDTGAPLHLLDQLAVDGAPEPEAIVVAAGPTPELVSFIRGLVLVPGVIVENRVRPRARRLAPGATARGTARVPLPLRAWHNFIAARHLPPLSANARYAVLDIEYTRGTERGPGRVVRGRPRRLDGLEPDRGGEDADR